MAVSSDATLIDRFLEMLSVERGASLNTRTAYARDLTQASQVLNGQLAQASGGALEGLIREWKPLAASSLARKLSVIGGFFGFLVEEGVRADDPSRQLARPRRPRPLPKVLTPQEVDALFRTLTERNAGNPGRPDLRLSALLELLYGSGLRASELVSLPRSALRDGQPFLIVKGKGAKERLVPISERAAGAVSAWERTLPGGARYLFPSRAGHLSRQRLFQLLRGLAAQAGIAPERVSPHVLRHAFATHLLAGGADLRALQAMLGHADVATTEIYTHVAADRLVSLVNERHPLARHHAVRAID